MKKFDFKFTVVLVLNLLMAVTSFADMGPPSQLVLNDGTTLDRFIPTAESCQKFRGLADNYKAEENKTLFVNLIYELYFPGEVEISSNFKVDNLTEEQKIFVMRG